MRLSDLLDGFPMMFGHARARPVVRFGQMRGGRLIESPRRSPVRRPDPLLITFCNVWPPGFHRAVLAPDLGWFRWLTDPDDLEPLDGADGLRASSSGDALWSLDQKFGMGSLLTRLAPDGSWLSREPLEAISDGHDLAETPAGLAIADTGHDRVALRDRDGTWRTLWAASDALTDTHHVNGLAIHDGQLFATAFGPKDGESWRIAAGGYIVNCQSGAVLHSGIAHPHSLVSSGRALWWCESATAKIWRLDPARRAAPTVAAQLRGYLRGLMVTRRHILVAASARRTVSRHLGVTIPVPQDSMHVDEAVLYVIDRRTKGVVIAPLGHMGVEVFALAPAPRAMVAPDEASMMAGIKARFARASHLAAPVA